MKWNNKVKRVYTKRQKIPAKWKIKNKWDIFWICKKLLGNLCDNLKEKVNQIIVICKQKSIIKKA